MVLCSILKRVLMHMLLLNPRCHVPPTWQERLWRAGCTFAKPSYSLSVLIAFLGASHALLYEPGPKNGQSFNKPEKVSDKVPVQPLTKQLPVYLLPFSRASRGASHGLCIFTCTTKSLQLKAMDHMHLSCNSLHQMVNRQEFPMIRIFCGTRGVPPTRIFTHSLTIWLTFTHFCLLWIFYTTP